MSAGEDKSDYRTAKELAAAAGVSESTIWRLKKAGKIPFFQPGGDDCSVKFPPDAFEQQSPLRKKSVERETNEENPQQINAGKNHLSGQRPKWMREAPQFNYPATEVRRTE